MRFSMLKIVGVRRNGGTYEYESTIMKMGGSTPWKNTFESQYEMVSIVNAVLARQKGECDVRHVIGKILDGGHYFFDFEMTEEQARCLGWQSRPEIVSSVAAD